MHDFAHGNMLCSQQEDANVIKLSGYVQLKLDEKKVILIKPIPFSFS